MEKNTNSPAPTTTQEMTQQPAKLDTYFTGDQNYVGYGVLTILALLILYGLYRSFWSGGNTTLRR